MRLKRLWINGFKNLNDFEIDFTDKNGITVLIGNNGSGKSNVLEAISSIFIGLYKMNTPQRKPNFEYEIEYILEEENYHISLTKSQQGDMIYSFHKNLNQIQVGHFKSNYIEYLPTNIIAIYSGEEMRLWEEYYKHSYNDFMKDVKENLQVLSSPKLIYVNKYYWDISLLALLYSDLESNQEFCKKILNIEDLNSVNISMKFNTSNLSNFEDNSIVAFVKSLNISDEVDKIVTIEELRNNQLIGSEKDLFLKLIASIMDKSSKYKLIENIKINFQNNLTTGLLSEGEKKQILIKTALEVIADTNSLVLFDEPDSHIHVANKGQLKDMLLEYNNRDTILTTHSPTLMNIFDNHLVYLENGEKKGKEKAEILKEISGDTMSSTQQQILLNSNTDILIVEGKTDEKYITTALEKLKSVYSEFEDLEFNFLYMGGSDPENLNKLINEFPPKKNQTVIAFFDRDKSGLNCIKSVCTHTGTKDDFFGDIKNGIHVYFYPKKDGFTHSDFEIEDYFNIETCRNFMFDDFSTFQDTKKKFKKNDFAEYCLNLEASEFDGFKKLFELIKTVKGANL